MSRTHFEQNMDEFVNSPKFYKVKVLVLQEHDTKQDAANFYN
jgi:hypothetical protein